MTVTVTLLGTNMLPQGEGSKPARLSRGLGPGGNSSVRLVGCGIVSQVNLLAIIGRPIPPKLVVPTGSGLDMSMRG